MDTVVEYVLSQFPLWKESIDRLYDEHGYFQEMCADFVEVADTLALRWHHPEIPQSSIEDLRTLLKELDEEIWMTLSEEADWSNNQDDPHPLP